MLLYIAVIQNCEVVCEYSDQNGDFSDLSIKVLKANYNKSTNQNINGASVDSISSDSKNKYDFFIIPYDEENYSFYYFIHEKFSLVCIVNNQYQQSNDSTMESSFLLSNTKINEKNSLIADKILLYLETLSHNILYKFNFSLSMKSNTKNIISLTHLLKTSLLDFNSIISNDSLFNEDKFKLIENELNILKKEKHDLLAKMIDKEMDIETIYHKSESLKISSWNIKQTIRFKNSKVKKSNFCQNIVLLVTFVLVCLILIFNYEVLLSLMNKLNNSSDFADSITNINLQKPIKFEPINKNELDKEELDFNSFKKYVNEMQNIKLKNLKPIPSKNSHLDKKPFENIKIDKTDKSFSNS